MAGAMIDVVVPVYNAADDLERCVDSVLAHTDGDYRLILIDDASPDPAIRIYFAALAARALPQLTLLANERNLGFTLNANRGMTAARPHADVVLLNSDTIVTRGWLAALARCARSDATIGTITPFSNNAEICSLPDFCRNNFWPPARPTEPMVRALELSAVPSYPDLPTGVGFCFYIRRPLLDRIGGFSPVFGLGYGEENDFCMRAAAAGFRNVLCDDAFVLHMGSSSFGEQRSDLAERNMQILLERHPSYLEIVQRYIAADPLRPLRALALSQYRALTAGLAGVLHVIHGHGGGTEYHVRGLIAASAATFRHYLLIAVGDDWQLEEHEDASVHSYQFRRLHTESWSQLLHGLCDRFSVDLIHLHNISGCREGLLSALEAIDRPYGYTVHDLNFACPTITFLNADHVYCGAVTDPTVCRSCLAAQPAFMGVDIEAWRAEHRGLLARAAFVIAPSRWAASILNKYFPEHDVKIIAHGGASGMDYGARPDAVRTMLPMPADDIPVVAVLGAIGPDKGARRLERLVELTRERGLRLRWVLIGYLDKGREPWQSADGVFTMHGPYDVRMLPALLDHYRVRLVAYPSAGPETFSFTLSEVWAQGRPTVVPPIGALADRVAATGAGWVLTDGEWRSESQMLERIATILDTDRQPAFTSAVARASAFTPTTIAAMTAATADVYRAALADSATASGAAEPLSAQRCLDALGYVSWRPPREDQLSVAPDSPVPPAALTATGAPATNGVHAPDMLDQVARAALRIRHTPAGRVLYRLTPASLLALLRNRLTR